MTADSSSASPPTSDRRDFLAAALGGLAVCCIGGIAGGCTIPPRTFRAPAGRIVRVPLAQYPELERPGGVVKVYTREVDVVFVRREADGSYGALSAICTHQGCTVATA